MNIYIVEFFDFQQESYDQMRVDADTPEQAVAEAKRRLGKGFARFRAYLKHAAAGPTSH